MVLSPILDPINMSVCTSLNFSHSDFPTIDFNCSDSSFLVSDLSNNKYFKSNKCLKSLFVESKNEITAYK